MNKSTINKIVASPMSNLLMEKYFDGNCNWINLSDVEKFSSIDDVFKNKSYCIIFIAVNSPVDGHWIVLLKNKTGIYYFDSLADPPLYIITKLPQKFGQTTKLLQLIGNSPFRNSFFYNSFDYQKDSANVNTCGRYAVYGSVLNIVLMKKGIDFNFDILYQVLSRLKTKDNTYDQIVSAFVDKIG